MKSQKIIEDLQKHKSTLLNLKDNKTYLMGILNLTPDSFFDGGEYSKSLYSDNYKSLFKYADIVDVGAESSRPFSNPISVAEELDRLSIINEIDLSDKLLSIDSYKEEVIEACLENGFNMINDISGGGKNNENINLASKYNVPIVIMHMKGTPTNMQVNPKYSNVIDDIKYFFECKLNYVEKHGINKKNIILDPGIGFGKSSKDNYKIILNLKEFKDFGPKLLIGISRKSFLSIENDSPSDRLYSSLGALSVAILNGADIVRVHDVEKTAKMIMPIDQMKYNM